MYTCIEGEVFKGKDKKVGALLATARCSLLNQVSPNQCLVAKVPSAIYAAVTVCGCT